MIALILYLLGLPLTYACFEEVVRAQEKSYPRFICWMIVVSWPIASTIMLSIWLYGKFKRS